MSPISPSARPHLTAICCAALLVAGCVVVPESKPEKPANTTAASTASTNAQMQSPPKSPVLALSRPEDEFHKPMPPTREAPGPVYRPLQAAHPKVAQIVLFRDPRNVFGIGEEASVFINGQQYMTLLPNAYATFCVAPGNYHLAAAGMRAAGFQQAGRVPAVRYEGGQTYFLKVRDRLGENASQLIRINRDIAETELSTARAQTDTTKEHPLVVSCSPKDPPPPPKVKPALFTLSADALFKFSKSGEQDLLQTGRVSVQELVKTLHTQFQRIDHIRVIGHTDPMGSHELNDKLSYDRAVTISRLLIQQGVPQSHISVDGRGKREIVKTGCDAISNREEKILCNLPNRRVELEVTGERRVLMPAGAAADQSAVVR